MSRKLFLRRFFAPECRNVAGGYHRALQARLPESGAVLDLGCGANTDLAPYRTERREVWGTDFQAHPELQHASWFRPLEPDGSIPFPANSFDLVTACWVLEHVQTPREFIREVSRVLRPGGWFVALTPNSAHYVAWVIWALGQLPHALTQTIVHRLYGRAHHDTFPTYYRLNTTGRLRRCGAESGLELAQVGRYINPHYFAFSEICWRAAVVTDWLLDRVHPSLGRLYLVATLRKAVNAKQPAGADTGPAGLHRAA